MRLILASALIVGGLAGCGKTMEFQGQSTLAITGTPPPVAEAPKPPRVEVRDNKIEIHEKVQFDYDKATIKPESFSLLDEVAAVIAKNPQIKKISVEGHASADGEPHHNKTLSDQRAKAVMKYLTDHKIPAAELSAIGYGSDKPIADNNTPDGREKNRRVEFTIVQQDVTEKRVEIDPKTGAEKVIDEKHETVGSPTAATATPKGNP
jgi:OOP family OmpA-OmpF porin